MNTGMTNRQRTGRHMKRTVTELAVIRFPAELRAHPRAARGKPSVVASKSRIGRIRRAVKREFIVSGGRPILGRQVLERAYCRLRRFTTWHYLAARRALRSEGATVIARNRFGRGRPCLWAPRDMGAT